MDMNELLDAAKTASNSHNDSALARALKTTPACVSNWRKSKNYPNAVTCEKIAVITGVPLARVLGIAGEARAISREEKAVWRRLASAAAVAIFALSGLLVFPTNGHAGTESISRNQANTVYYVQTTYTEMRSVGWLAALIGWRYPYICLRWMAQR